jgi:hypothetical protein
MSVDVKNYQWHPVWHSKRSQDENYRSLPLDHIGALTEMERLAGQTNNNGSLSLYGDKRRRMTDEEVVAHLAGRTETTKQRARKIFNRLVEDKYVRVEKRTKFAVLSYWKHWQVKGKFGSAPSEDAARQRRSRETRRGDLMRRAKTHLNTVVDQNMSQPICATLLGKWMNKTKRAGANLLDDMVKAGLLEIDAKGNVCSDARPAGASASPPSNPDSVSGSELVTHSRDKSHIEENEEIEEEQNDTYVSSNSVSKVESPVALAPAGTRRHSGSSFGGGRSARREPDPMIDLHTIWDPARCEFTEDPRAVLEERWCVEAAQIITGDCMLYARNTWDKWIDGWPGVPGSGVAEFRKAVADLIELLYDGNVGACKNPAAYLNGILKRRVQHFGKIGA